MTLVELMISLLIMSIAVTATLALGYSMSNAYTTHRRMIVVERSARVSLEVLSEAVRGASPSVPTARIEDLVGCSAYGGLRVTNSTSQPDQLEVVYASGGVFTSLRATYGDGDDFMTVLDGSAFAVGDQVLVSDFAQGHLVEITAIAQVGAVWQLTTGAPSTKCSGLQIAFPGGGYPTGALVLRGQVSRFYVDTLMAGGAPTLMMDPDSDGPADPEPLSEGVDDLQIAIGVDMDGDGTVLDDGTTTDEWFYNNPGDSDPPLPTITPPRAYRITVIARSITESSTEADAFRPGAEDRSIATTPDVYRRRLLSTTVEIRNLDGSP